MEEKNTVPYIIHEGCLTRDERIIKRLVIALILTIVLMFASNVSVENTSFGATAADTPTAINVQNANLVVSRIA